MPSGSNASGARPPSGDRAQEEPAEEWRSLRLRFGAHDCKPAPGQQGSPDNSVFTGKYTFWSFLPKGIFEQFRRVANVFFLIISIMMGIGTYVEGTWYSSLDPWTTIGPLMIIVGLTLAKEGHEDSKRHAADKQVNTRVAEVLVADGGFEQVEWSSLQPGMVVRILDRGEFPADLVPLASSEDEGKCYIETANIDGETNLKLRMSAFGQRRFLGAEDLLGAARLQGGGGVLLSFEPPSPSIHSFNATLEDRGTPDGPRGTAALGAQELLLRGAVLRNTKFILGVIVYTGFETKLVMNSREAPSKMSTIEVTVNKIIYFILGAMCVLTSLTTMGYALWNAGNGHALWYMCKSLNEAGSNYPDLFESSCERGTWKAYPTASLWPTFFILYNNFLPISIYVTIELVNVAQAYFISQDINMYHEEQDTPALARTSNMNGDLGQIEYIFSDKTGTLTCNEMRFKRCCVGGQVYGDPISPAGEAAGPAPKLNRLAALVTQSHGKRAELGGAGPQSSKGGEGVCDQAYCAVHMATLLATCHNVVLEDGRYMAESPDEEALVDGAATMGLKYLGQTGAALTLELQTQHETLHGNLNPTAASGASEGGAGAGAKADRKAGFQLLATIPFSSSRKRMSVVLKDEATGGHWLYTKGADNVMFDRTLKGDGPGQGYGKVGGKLLLDTQLEVFAKEGLRTLVIGHRELSASEALGWCKTWKRATESTRDREGAMARAAAELEKDLVLLGGTGIEDRLQDGVPDAIEHLKTAGIKVWVLTGDKMTTAIEIGLSCRLLTQNMKRLLIKAGDNEGGLSVQETLAQYAAKYGQKKTQESPKGGGTQQPLGLVMDGPSLTEILGDPRLTRQLLGVAGNCAAVIACRVSPAQKQLIVKMVKEGLPHRPVTLSIGDGANDVPMIQEAQIGVGISGKEGRQAVNSSDFAIAQFRYLENLLLVHGRWNYRRISKVILYSFYKNIVLTIILAWWTMDCGFSGQSLYESYVYAGYNFFLGVPILLLGIFDQDVTEATALRFQQLYYVGKEHVDLNVLVMVENFIQAALDATVIYFLSLGTFNGPSLAGDTPGAGRLAASPPGSVWNESGQSDGLYVFGTAVFSYMVAAMLIKVSLMHASWNWTAYAGLAFSVGLYLGFILLYGSMARDRSGSFTAEWLASYDFYHTPYMVLDAAGFWLSGTLICTVLALVDLVILVVKTQVFKTKLQVVREFELLHSSPNAASAPGRHFSGSSDSTSLDSIESGNTFASSATVQQIRVAPPSRNK